MAFEQQVLYYLVRYNAPYFAIRDRQDQIPVPDSHKVELDKRFERHEKFQGKILTLDELRQRIESRK